MLLALAFTVPVIASAQADAYPAKPVRIIVPFAAGGVADVLARIVAERLSQKWGQPVIIDNKPGASGNIGMADGARAPPDDYTLLLAPAGNLTVSPTLFSRKAVPRLTVTHREHLYPGHLARAITQRAGRASIGPGKDRIKTVHVPYKGIAPAVNDLLGGNVQMMFAGISTILQYVKSGKLVALAIAAPTRNSQLPDVPTVAESGFPGFDVTSWYGIVVRAGTPPEIVRKVQRDMAAVLQSEDVKIRLAGLGLDPSAIRRRTSMF